MALAIRDVREHDLDAVLALNNAAGRSILALEAQQLRYLYDHADYFRVADVDGHLAGFLIALREGGDYESPNYRWFADHYPQFVYIDRIVIAGAHRGAGLGRVFYADVQSFAELRYPQLACEVFLEQGSDPALLFHGSFGFREIGQHVLPSSDGVPGRRAAMLMKELCSYAWVRDTYGPELPNVPWIVSARPANDVAAHRATGT